jgi:hypothetical protein
VPSGIAITQKMTDFPDSSYFTMKITLIITLLSGAFFFSGCATQDSESTQGETAPATGGPSQNESEVTAKTAYEGATGPGLLMERYKSGQIEGFKN